MQFAAAVNAIQLVPSSQPSSAAPLRLPWTPFDQLNPTEIALRHNSFSFRDSAAASLNAECWMLNVGCWMFYLRQLLAHFPAARVQVGGACHVAAGGQEEQQQLEQDPQDLVGGTAHHREQREQQEGLWATSKRIKQLYIHEPPTQQINTEQLLFTPATSATHVHVCALQMLTSRLELRYKCTFFQGVWNFILYT